MKRGLLLVAVAVVLTFLLLRDPSPSFESPSGLQVSANPEPSPQSSVAEATETDVLVWQGQYYTGTTFNTGTYEFNFTVYDAKIGGGRAILT